GGHVFVGNGRTRPTRRSRGRGSLFRFAGATSTADTWALLKALFHGGCLFWNVGDAFLLRRIGCSALTFRALALRPLALVATHLRPGRANENCGLRWVEDNRPQPLGNIFECCLLNRARVDEQCHEATHDNEEKNHDRRNAPKRAIWFEER